MLHTTLRRLLVLALAAIVSVPVAHAQLKLPRRPAEGPAAERGGGIAPYMTCLVCNSRTYTAHVDGRKDESGHDLVWCATCKRDTAHQSGVNTEPGLGDGSGRARGTLKLPDAAGAGAAPRPGPVPSAPAQAAPVGAAERTLALAVFDDLKRARSVSDPLLASAVTSLVAAGEAGLAAARLETVSEDAHRLLVAVRTLLRAGNEADLELVRARMRAKLPALVVPFLVDEMAARDPVRSGPEWLASLLEHSQGFVRQAAQRNLATVEGELLIPHLERCAADKRVDTRVAAIELASGVRDARATELLLTHLDDVSSRVAKAAVDGLALREEPALDARLLSIAFKDRWLLRRGAYALLAIIEREDLRLQPILAAAHIEPLLAALDKRDTLVSGAAAAALAGIGFRSSSAQVDEWLDRPVIDRLIMTVSGREFHDDLSSITPGALRRLRMVSGQSIATDGPRWVDWWITAREGFRARRATLTIQPGEAASTLVRFESTAENPEGFTLVGPELASTALTRVTSGEIFYLTQDQITDLIAVLNREGLLGAEILPGLRGARGRGERTLEIQVGARAKAFTLGPDLKETWFERAAEACRAVRDQNRWQRFPAGRDGQDAYALWQAEASWWSTPHTDLERNERLKQLALNSMQGASPAKREIAVEEIERLYALPDGPNAADFDAFLALLDEEQLQGTRASRLARLALAAGRKMGSDGFVPDAPALALAGAYTRLFGTNAIDALAEQFQSVRREFVRQIAADERPILRAVAAKTLAVDPSPEDLAILIKLLSDKDLSVETAAVTALGEHKVEAARTELLVRARVGFPPVRAAALRAIGMLGGEFVLEALIQGVNDRDRVVHIAAAQGLALLGDPAAAQVLISALAEVSDTELFDAARAGLVAIGRPAWHELVRVVNQPAGRIRREAALILSEQCHPDAVSALISILTANPKDARVATELTVLTCVDLRGQVDPARSWWAWWDGVRHDDSSAWFRAALERAGIAPPPPGAFEGAGTVQGRLFLVSVMSRSEPWLVERARREYSRMTGRNLGELPSVGRDRDAWLRDLREAAAKDDSRG
ncbi:MAG: HEAT repeat domain-containing protein [Planctomycetes bacterium]|nr:HEAT repeat domain-containing protein [Planctomycetota bacterium]